MLEALLEGLLRWPESDWGKHPVGQLHSQQHQRVESAGGMFLHELYPTSIQTSEAPHHRDYLLRGYQNAQIPS